MSLRFLKKYAKLILEGKKTLELRRYPPVKEVYAIQVGFEVQGYFRVRGHYKKAIYDLTPDEISRAGFRDRAELLSEAVRLGLWPECYVWQIEVLPPGDRERELAEERAPHEPRARAGGRREGGGRSVRSIPSSRFRRRNRRRRRKRR